MRSVAFAVAVVLFACSGNETADSADSAEGSVDNGCFAKPCMGFQRWFCESATTYRRFRNVPTPCGFDCQLDQISPPSVCPPTTTCSKSAGIDSPCAPGVDAGDAGSGGDADAGADANSTPYDGPSYTADDFASFQWQFYGGTGGPRELFVMDHDCGIEASNDDGAAAPSGSGLVASGDCKSFQTLVVSPKVLGALESTATCVPLVTDDPEHTRVVVTSGTVYDRDTSGCKASEPF